jgi:8-oxo-dGTP pyrophosphatase MutT (NUDIX family)
MSFDPRVQPAVVANEGLEPLAANVLTPEALRAALSLARARSVLRSTDYASAYPGRAGVTVLAAVLLALVRRADGIHLVLTERASHLHDHPGQISLPGGRIETTDVSPEAAAVREATEEIGLAPSYIEVLGRMAPYTTVTGFCITPVVALVRPGFTYAANAFEVAKIFEVPLVYVMNPNNHMQHCLTLTGGHSRHYFSMTWEHFFIWGATAGMLRNFYHLLRQAQSLLSPTGPR